MESEEAPKDTESSSIPALRLLYSAGSGVIKPPARLVLNAGDTALGRAATDGICLSNDARISQLHCVFSVGRTGAVTVADATSKNGTFVNGRRIAKRDLQDGDVIQVGDTFLLYRRDPGTAEEEGDPIPEMVGWSVAMHKLRRCICMVAPQSATVLLQGETGTGKEVAATALHRLSRKTGKFVAINCAALPESLAESQLFGQVPGSFTGAQRAPGFFRAAMGGTLFLDELGELPLTLQAKLLRALQERAVVPVGAVDPISFDARIIAATNRNLVAEARKGTFRCDLLARLQGVPLFMPPLRERREDILGLLLHALGLPALLLTPRVVAALLLHTYSFNVREIMQLAVHIRAYAPAGADLDADMIEERLRAAPGVVQPDTRRGELTERREAVSAEQVSAAYHASGGNISLMARLLQRSRKHVRRLLDQYGLHTPR